MSEEFEPTENQLRLRALQETAFEAGDGAGWFEPLYAAAAKGEAEIPWDDGKPNPNLVEWLEREKINGEGKRALEVGCGYGQGALALAQAGFQVTAVDLSPSAIAHAAKHNAHPNIQHRVVNMFEPPAEFAGAFDLVVEIYTLQAIPADIRPRLAQQLPGLVAKNGELILVSRARDEETPATGPPWPLTENEIRGLTHGGPLSLVRLERYQDWEDKERFRAHFRA
ncbi:MAG: methyltransferase domain-containing protein [Planctomycetota bacterium]|nr:methyltransferase domain-containing protein [Planctomycetota bacterium]